MKINIARIFSVITQWKLNGALHVRFYIHLVILFAEFFVRYYMEKESSGIRNFGIVANRFKKSEKKYKSKKKETGI